MAPTNKQSMIRWNLPIYQQNDMSQWGGVAPMTSIPSNIAAPQAPPPSAYAASTPSLSTNTGFGEDFMSPVKDPASITKPPSVEGAWVKPAQIGLGVAQVGLGVYNALEQSKMNKFMRGYYGDQMDLQRADFTNNARSTNEALEARARTRASAAGHSFDSAENKAAVSSYMDQWGVKETF